MLAEQSRASTFRHLQCQVGTPENCFNWGPGQAGPLAVNPKFLAVAVETSCGGQVVVGKLTECGKPLGLVLEKLDHQAHVTELRWNPFNDNILACACLDGTVSIWYITDDVSVTRIRQLTKNNRKIESFNWHRTVDDVILVASADGLICLWDIGEDKIIAKTVEFEMSSVDFSPCSKLFSAIGKSNNRLVVFDSRTFSITYSVNTPHDGTMARKAIFCSKRLILTCGSTKTNRRQLALFSIESQNPLVIVDLEEGSGQLSIFFDFDLSIAYVSGKGESVMRTFEVLESEPYLQKLAHIQLPTAHSHITFAPKRALSLELSEVMRIYRIQSISKAHELHIQPISFVVPRRSKGFHSELYPPTCAPTAAVSLAEWLAGLDVPPVKFVLKPGLPMTTSKPVMFKCSSTKESPKLITTDKNNDRKFKFLSEVTKADYRVINEREDKERLLLIELVHQKLLQENKSEMENDEKCSNFIESEPISPPPSLEDCLSSAQHSPLATESPDPTSHLPLDVGLAEASAEEFGDKVHYEESVERPELVDTHVDALSEQASDSTPTDRIDSFTLMNTSLMQNFAADGSAPLAAVDDEFDDDEDDEYSEAKDPPDMLDERMVSAGEILRLRLDSTSTDDLEMLPSPAKSEELAISMATLRSNGCETTISDRSSASGGPRKRLVDEPIDVETNPFRQYFFQESDTVKSDQGHEENLDPSKLKAVVNSIEENGNPQTMTASSQDQRLLENTVVMLEQCLQTANSRVALLEKQCEQYERDAESLRFEIQWKDERIEFLQRSLARQEQENDRSES